MAAVLIMENCYRRCALFVKTVLFVVMISWYGGWLSTAVILYSFIFYLIHCKAPFTLCFFVPFAREISSVNSQLSKEISKSYFAKFRRRNFAYGALWLVSRPVFTNIEQSVVDVGFRKFISSVKVFTFERKISKFFFPNRISKLISNVKGA